MEIEMDYKRIAAVAALTVAMAAPCVAQAATIGASQQHRRHDYRMYRRAQEGVYRPAYGYWYPAPFDAGPYASYLGPYAYYYAPYAY